MDWTVSPLSPNIYFQALTPDVMILGDGILGRYLNLDTILRVGLSWWNYCSHKTKQGVCCLSPSTTYKEIVRRQSSVIQKWKLSSEIEFWYLDFGILVFITKRKEIFLTLNHLVWSLLLRQFMLLKMVISAHLGDFQYE